MGNDRLQDVLSPQLSDILNGGVGADQLNCFDGNWGGVDVAFGALGTDEFWADEFGNPFGWFPGDDLPDRNVLTEAWHTFATMLFPANGLTKPIEP